MIAKFTCSLFTASLLFYTNIQAQQKDAITKNIVINLDTKFQTIDGFGANVNPAEWRNGSMKPALHSIVKDLGSTLVRFDCIGLANWLDPEQQQPGGSFTEAYLQKVYTSQPFKNAWAAFRYLNELGVEPMFNVSGAVPAAWTTINPAPAAWTVLPPNTHDRLKDFDSYATMIATMLKWAREKEHLKFSCLMPFNETDLGFPEGPRLMDEDCILAFEAVVKKLAAYNLDDIVYILMDDSGEHPERLKNIISNAAAKHRIKALSLHTYGGGEQGQVMVRKMMDSSGFKNKSLWLTEFGDLDQTEEIEFEIGLRISKRLIAALNNNLSGAIVWDAFDNYHKHDSAFALYGLLKTDTVNWTYQPKERFYAVKQVFKFVLPGFQRVGIETPADKPVHIYNEWTHTLRNIPLAAFVSADGKDFTLTGVNTAEKSVKLNIRLKGSAAFSNKNIYTYRTSEKEHCIKTSSMAVSTNSIGVELPPHCVFTVTTLRQ